MDSESSDNSINFGDFCNFSDFEKSAKQIATIQRTQIFKKLHTTPQALFDNLQAIQPDLAKFITDVRRDVMDTKRFHVTYATLEARRAASSRGFHLGEVEIPPMHGDSLGFIPYVSPGLGESDLKTLLATYGEVTEGSFQMLRDGKTKTNGYVDR